jgi:hypothetical protein
MQERVAGTVGERDEAETLVRVVPLDGSSEERAGGDVESLAGRVRRRLVVVVGEITATGRTKISVLVVNVGFRGAGN